MNVSPAEPFALVERHLAKAEQAARLIEATADEALRAQWQEIANTYLTLVQIALDAVVGLPAGISR